jgi:excisionase family DNA binding protein
MSGALVSAATAARVLGLSRQTIVRHIASGVIAGRKIGARWWVYRTALATLRDETTAPRAASNGTGR